MSEPALNLYGKPLGDGPKPIPSASPEPSKAEAASETKAVARTQNGKLHHRSTEYLEKSGVALCGDFGGVMANGKPCTREAGHGVNDTFTGKCWLHTDEKLDWQQTAKRAFLEAYADQPATARGAAAKAGVTTTTIWRWRHVDKQFDEEVRALMAVVDDVRGQMVEDSALLRAIDPTTNADAMRMYLLQNYRPQKFRDMRRLEHTGANGGPMESVNHNVRWNIGGTSHFFFGQTPEAEGGSPRDLAQVEDAQTSDEP